MTRFEWPTGLLTALATPTSEDGIDMVTFEELIDQQILAGVAGLVVCGGTGEFGTLTLSERRALAEAAVKTAAGRVPVIVHTGALSTRDAVGLSRHAEEVEVDALLVASPFGEPINWPERRTYYERVVGATSLPVMLYNTPPAGLLTFAQVTELATLPHVSAIKDSSGNSTFMGDLLESALDLAIYVGSDNLLWVATLAGVRGAVLGSANLIPEALITVIRSAEDSGPEARARWSAVRELLRFMEESPNYVALCKAGLALRGLAAGSVREPYLMPSDSEVQQLNELVAVIRQEPVSRSRNRALAGERS